MAYKLKFYLISSIYQICSGLIYVFLYFTAPKVDLEDRITTILSLGLKSPYLPKNILFQDNIYRIFGVGIYDFSSILGTNLPLHNFLSQLVGPFFYLNLSDVVFRFAIIFFIGFFVGKIFAYFLSFKTIESNYKITIFSVFILISYFPLFICLHLNDWFIFSFSFLSFILLISIFLDIERQNIDAIGITMRLSIVNRSIFLFAILPFGHFSVMPMLIVLILIHSILYSKNYMLFFTRIRFNFFQLSILTIAIVNILLSFWFVISSVPDNLPPRIIDPLKFSFLFSNGRTFTVSYFIIFCLWFSFSLKYKYADIRNVLFVLISFGLFVLEPISERISVSATWLIRDFFWLYFLLLIASTLKEVNLKLTIFSSKRFLKTSAILIISIISLCGILLPLKDILSQNNNRPDNVENLNSSELSSLYNYGILKKGVRVVTIDDELIRTPNSLSGLHSLLELSNSGVMVLSGWSKVRDQSNLINSDKLFENKTFITSCDLRLFLFTMPELIFMPKSNRKCNTAIRNSSMFSQITKPVLKNYEIYRPIYNIINTVNYSVNLPQKKCAIYQSDCDRFWNSVTGVKTLINIEELNFLKLCDYKDHSSLCVKLNADWKGKTIVLPISFNRNLKVECTHNSCYLEEHLGFVKFHSNDNANTIIYEPDFFDFAYCCIGWLYYIILFTMLIRLWAKTINSDIEI